MRALIFLACAIGIAGWVVHQNTLRRQMLRTDADAIPRSAALYAFARRRGHGAFDEHCAGCHGADARGDRSLGAPSLADREWLYGSGSAAEIEWTIAHGIRAPDPRSWNLAVMPAYASPTPSAIAGISPLSPPQIRDVAEYLLALGQRAPFSDAAARGNAVFHGPGGCFDCHGADARGDPAIGAPDLTDTIWLYGDGSRAALFESIARGRHGMCPAWTGRLDAATIRALAVYVYSLSAADARRR